MKKHTHIPRDRKTNEHLATFELLKIAIQTESYVGIEVRLTVVFLIKRYPNLT